MLTEREQKAVKTLRQIRDRNATCCCVSVKYDLIDDAKRESRIALAAQTGVVRLFKRDLRS